jgi:hypothetical protein
VSSTDPLYQARAETLEQIERGRDNLLQQPIYDAGALVAPTALGSTCTVYDGSNAVVATPTVSVVGSVAVATLLAASTSSLSLGEGWRVEWVLLIAGAARKVRRDAALVLSRLLPPATLADLFRIDPALDPDGDHPIHSMTAAELDPFLDEAWIRIEGKLMSNGRRPWLAMSPQSFRELHCNKSLELIFRSFATRLNPAYLDMARFYAGEADKSWPELRFAYDSNQDGVADGGGEPVQVGGPTSVWLGSIGAQDIPDSPWRF